MSFLRSDQILCLIFIALRTSIIIPKTNTTHKITINIIKKQKIFMIVQNEHKEMSKYHRYRNIKNL